VATTLCKLLGSIFVVIGLLIIVRGAPVDRYHNLLHLVWGAMALLIGFGAPAVTAKWFVTGSGAAYLILGLCGMLLGNPMMNLEWHIGQMHLHGDDHKFHLVLGTLMLMAGLLSGHRLSLRRAVEGGVPPPLP
jgi:hypothetical protein